MLATTPTPKDAWMTLSPARYESLGEYPRGGFDGSKSAICGAGVAVPRVFRRRGRPHELEPELAPPLLGAGAFFSPR
jgi:hypothetical protein